MWSMPEENKIPTRKENIKYWCYITSLILFIVVLISGFFTYLLMFWYQNISRNHQ